MTGTSSWSRSIRAAGRVAIPSSGFWYALRAMGGYHEEPGRGGSLAAHDYARSKDLPALGDVGTHSAAGWSATGSVF